MTGPEYHFSVLSSTCITFWAECVRHLRSNFDPIISASDIGAKISVYEIKIGTLNAPLIFHQQITVLNNSQGELVTTITKILVRMVI